MYDIDAFSMVLNGYSVSISGHFESFFHDGSKAD